MNITNPLQRPLKSGVRSGATAREFYCFIELKDFQDALRGERMMKWVVLLPGLLIITMMAFCAGIQVAMLYGSKSSFAVGRIWLIGDLIGVVIGVLFCIFAARRFVWP